MGKKLYTYNLADYLNVGARPRPHGKLYDVHIYIKSPTVSRRQLTGLSSLVYLIYIYIIYVLIR